MSGDLPKPLVEVGGKPFLFWKMNYISLLGVQRVIFSLGFQGKQIEEYVSGNWDFADFEFKYDSVSGQGTGIAIKESFPDSENRCLVTYADNLTSVNIEQMLEISDSNSVSVVSCQKFDSSLGVAPNIRFWGENGQVHFGKSALATHVDHGLNVLRRSDLLDHFDSSLTSDLGSLYTRISENNRLRALVSERSFLEMGTPISWRNADRTIGEYYQGYEFYR